MSSSLPSANNDYAAPADMALSRAAWDAALVSVGTRLRALEAVKADFEALIELGTSQALAVISENVEPQLGVITTTLTALEQAIAEAEDTILQIITGSVPASAVSPTADRLWLTPTLRDTWNAKQAGNAKLSALAALTLAANKLIYATDESALATTDLSELARTLLAAATSSAMRTAIGAAGSDLAALSVLGRAASSSGAMAAITAATNGDILYRSGTSLTFGTPPVIASTVDAAIAATRMTTATAPVGWEGLAWKTNSGTVANLGTTSGSNIVMPRFEDSAGWLDGEPQVGIFKNISGGTRAAYDLCMWTRTQ